jgi:hypothetical protein
MGGSHFFLEPSVLVSWGQVLRTTSVLKLFFPILRNAPVFRIQKKIWLGVSQGWFSQVGSHKLWFFVVYIYNYYFFHFKLFFGSLFSYNQRFFYGMKLSLAANLVLNWVCHVLSFPEGFEPMTAAAMYTVAINVLARGAFNAESQYFIPLFNNISWLCGPHPRGDEASNGGCNSGPTGPHDFQITLIFTFYFSAWEPDLSQNVRNGAILKWAVRWELGRFSLAGFHLQWETSTRFFWQLTNPVLTENRDENP